MRAAVALLGLLLLGCGAPATDPLTVNGASTASTAASAGSGADLTAARCAYLDGVAGQLADSRSGSARQTRRQLRALAAALQARQPPTGLEDVRDDVVRQLRDLAALAGEAEAAVDAAATAADEQSRLEGRTPDTRHAGGPPSAVGTLHTWGPFLAAAHAVDQELAERRAAHGCA